MRRLASKLLYKELNDHLSFHCNTLTDYQLSLYVAISTQSLCNSLIINRHNPTEIAHLWHDYDNCLAVYIRHSFNLDRPIPFELGRAMSLVQIAIEYNLPELLLISIFRGASYPQEMSWNNTSVLPSEYHSLFMATSQEFAHPFQLWCYIPRKLISAYDDSNSLYVHLILKSIEYCVDRQQTVIITPFVLYLIGKLPSLNKRLSYSPTSK